MCDEGHKLKNPGTLVFKCVASLPASRRLVLSGTPVQNNLGELWALLSLTAPGLLGCSATFRDAFERPIATGQSRNACARERAAGAAAAAALRRVISPALLRREKAALFGTGAPPPAPPPAPAPEVAPCEAPIVDEFSFDAPLHGGGCAGGACTPALPLAPLLPHGLAAAPAPSMGAKTEVVVWLRLTPLQARLYGAFASRPDARAAIAGPSPLAALAVLRKIVDHPGLLPADHFSLLSSCAAAAGAHAHADADAAIPGAPPPPCAPCAASDPSASSKASFVLQYVVSAAAAGHRTLLFSQSTKLLDALQASFETAGVPLLRIDGAVPAAERAARVARFQAQAGVSRTPSSSPPDIPLFLLSSGVGALGLTLTAADRVVMYDASWNPAADAQAVDRAYRLGRAFVLRAQCAADAALSFSPQHPAPSRALRHLTRDVPLPLPSPQRRGTWSCFASSRAARSKKKCIAPRWPRPPSRWAPHRPGDPAPTMMEAEAAARPTWRATFARPTCAGCSSSTPSPRAPPPAPPRTRSPPATGASTGRGWVQESTNPFCRILLSLQPPTTERCSPSPTTRRRARGRTRRGLGGR